MTANKLKLIVILVAFFCAAAGTAVGQFREIKIDSVLVDAKKKILEGDLEGGRKMLHTILPLNPDYYDVQILLARSYAWNNEREKARIELATVLRKKPDHEDAISAMYDVEVWDDNFSEALNLVDIGLKYYPNSPDLVYKKAVVLLKLDRATDALTVLSHLSEIAPGHAEGGLLREKIKLNTMKHDVSLTYSLNFFSRIFNPAHFVSLQLSRSTNRGSSLVRFNYASRFSSQGLQGEIDLYPKIKKGVYAYLNYGYSQSSLFSRHRIATEVYTKLPYRLEASGGMRYLYFGKHSKVLTYTGSVGYYFKSYWFSYRPYITPDDIGTLISSSLTARKYFKNTVSYVGMSLNIGFSPDERRIQSGSGLSSDGIFVLKSQSLGLNWQNTVSHRWILTATYTLVHQELNSLISQYVWMNSCLVGAKARF